MSTDDQAQNGHGLDEQDAALEAEAVKRGWEVVGRFVDEGVSRVKRHLGARPEGAKALAMMTAGEADVLVSSKLDRMCRSITNAGQLMEQAEAEGWRLSWLDLQVDTSTPSGELLASIVASTARYEGRMASVRTKEGLAAARAKGKAIGRPSVLPDEVVERIVQAKKDGMTYLAIAAMLEAEGVKTARGNNDWRVSTLHKIVNTEASRRSAPVAVSA